MKSLKKTVNVGFALTLILSISQFAKPEAASAQIFELATGALNLLTGNKSQPAPQPIIQPLPPQNREMTLGAGNFNGNSFNLCVSGCLPQASAPRPIPSFPVPSRPMGVPMPTQGSFATSSVQTQTGTLPPGAMVRPGVPLPPQAVPLPPEPQPRRPVLSIPPISLPFNL